MLILDLWGISFHPVVFVGSGNDLLFNFSVGHCDGSYIFSTRFLEANFSYLRVVFFLKILLSCTVSSQECTQTVYDI